MAWKRVFDTSIWRIDSSHHDPSARSARLITTHDAGSGASSKDGQVPIKGTISGPSVWGHVPATAISLGRRVAKPVDPDSQSGFRCRRHRWVSKGIGDGVGRTCEVVAQVMSWYAVARLV